MMTAGMAAKRPTAAASNASAIPGATMARFVVCTLEIADEAVHDTPDGSRQADEGSSGTDRRQSPDLKVREAAGDAFLDACLVRNLGR
jgi:hypothetical protein